MAKPILHYDTEQMKIIQENYEPQYAAKTESIFAQGNSYLGIRAVDDEYHQSNKEDFFLAGLYNKGDENEETELANLPNMLQQQIFIDGYLFESRRSDRYTKTLDLITGELKREIYCQRGGKEFKFTFLRTVSQRNKHIFVQKIVFEVLSDHSSDIELHPVIDGSVTNSGIMHFKEGEKRLIAPNLIRYITQTTASNETVIQNMRVVIDDKNYKQPSTYKDDNFVIFMQRRQIGFKSKFTISKNNPITVSKLMSVNSTQDSMPIKCSLNTALGTSDGLAEVLKNISYDTIHQQNIEDWEEIYSKWFVNIIGDSQDAKYDRLAFYFSIFHMNTFVPKYSEMYGVGAKGLSGEGYQGHNYWDTDIFITPTYILNFPNIARKMLKYRYNGIDGARKKAAENSYRGAQYPWESALPHEGEVTPYWGQPDIRTGKQIPIASRAQEIHVSSDVAFAVDMYYLITGDESFMEKYGYEMIIDTAIFWSERAEWRNDLNLYEITNVMGPNEYKGNVNNNAYINRLAKYNIDTAIKYIDKLSEENPKLLAEINTRIPYRYQVERLRHVSENIKIQKPNKDGIVAENDQYLSLEKKDISKFQMLGDAGKKLFNTTEGISKLSGQLTKQADVVLLNYLMSDDLTHDQLIKNWDFYEFSTTHDSSLSPSTYALAAIELRHRLDYAYDLFKYAINIDLGQNLSSSDKGIHAGSIAAIYQMIVFGYGGVKAFRSHLQINPILPKAWDGLEYSIRFREANIIVKVEREKFSISTTKEVAIYVQGERYLIKDTQWFPVK